MAHQPTLLRVPALSKIDEIRAERGLSINAFERETLLSPGIGSRILRGEYRPSAPVIFRIRRWSKGRIDLPDWLRPDELAQADQVPAKRPGKRAA